jgi:hypothetical protein
LGVCALSTSIIYTENIFGVGETLFSDITLLNEIAGYNYVVDTITNIVYNLNNVTGEVLSVTSIVCGSGVTGAYKLGNDITTICEADDVVLYTSGQFGIGKTMYEDINLTTILSIPYQYIIDSTTGYIYTMYNSVVISLTSGICGGGIEGVYRVSNTVTDICLEGEPTTLYTRSPFSVGVFLFTNIDLLEPFLGYTYIVNPANDYIYIVNPLTGEVLSQTNFACTASLYIRDIDAFEVEVAKLLNNNNCGCTD